MELLRQVTNHWAARSMGAGIVATIIDVVVLVFGVKVLHLGAVPAAVAGVALGGAVSFVLNKVVAFRDRLSPWWPQLVRFALALAAAMAIHALLMHSLAVLAHVHYLVAKLVADFLVFTCGSLLAMRFVVFRDAERGAAGRKAAVAPRSLAG